MANEGLCSMCQGGDSLALCERCAKNLEMLDLAQLFEEIKDAEESPTRDLQIPGLPVSLRVSERVPLDTLYFVPKRETLEHALEHDEAPDLRRYFGVIKNIRS